MPKSIVPANLPEKLPAWTFPSTISQALRADFHLIASLDGAPAESDGASGAEMHLLLSTCNDHESTFNACAFEVYSWLHHTRYNFDILLSRLETAHWASLVAAADRVEAEAISAHPPSLFDEGGLDLSTRIKLRVKAFEKLLGAPTLTTLFSNCHEYLAEYRHKHELFYAHFQRVRNALRTRFTKELFSRIFWEERIAKPAFLNATHVELISHKFIALDALEALAWKLTNYVEGWLCHWNLWTPGGTAASKIHANASPDLLASAYDDAVSDARNAYLGAWVKSTLGTVEAPSSAQERNIIVKAARTCFSEIKRCFDLWFPIYERNSLRPFLPEAGKTVFREFTDHSLYARFLLFIDIMNSKRAKTEVKSEIQVILGQRDRCYHTESTGNDAYLIVFEDWQAVLGVIRLLRTRTGLYKERDGYGGLRCSVAYGDCIERTFVADSTTLLMDTSQRPSIPIATYLNDQVDKLLEIHNLLPSRDKCIVADRSVAEVVAKKHRSASICPG